MRCCQAIWEDTKAHADRFLNAAYDNKMKVLFCLKLAKEMQQIEEII